MKRAVSRIGFGVLVAMTIIVIGCVILRDANAEK